MMARRSVLRWRLSHHLTVAESAEEAEASEVEAQPEDGHLGAYKPPKIAQAHLLTPCWRLVAFLTPH